MTNPEFGIAVGFSRYGDSDDDYVYLQIIDRGYVSIPPRIARYIGLQLIMAADHLESLAKTDDD